MGKHQLGKMWCAHLWKVVVHRPKGQQVFWEKRRNEAYHLFMQLVFEARELKHKQCIQMTRVRFMKANRTKCHPSRWSMQDVCDLLNDDLQTEDLIRAEWKHNDQPDTYLNKARSGIWARSPVARILKHMAGSHHAKS